MMKALITGILGQDGSYLTEFLVARGYEVHGIAENPLSLESIKIQNHLKYKGISFKLHLCDLNSYEEVENIIRIIKPDECYHLATIHFSSENSVQNRLETEQQLIKCNIISSNNICYAIMNSSPETRLVFAGSCFMYEDGNESPQNEDTPFIAYSPYSISKIAGSSIIRHLRNDYNMHFSTAILYNHESPRRPVSFVTKKIIYNLVRIKRGEIKKFVLGNLSAVKDWGYAKDYAAGMWLMCQQSEPRDFILATGQTHTIEDFLSIASGIVGVDWHNHVNVESGIIDRRKRCRLVGDWKSAKTLLGWSHSVSFEGLIELMYKNEIENDLD